LHGTDIELEARWSAWLLSRNRRGTRGLLLIVLVLYPAFGILDYLTAPAEWLWLLYSTRAVITLATIAMLRLLPGRLYDRNADVLSAGYVVLISSGITLMTVFMGGLASPYYAGLSLVIVATGLLYVWPLRIVIVTYATIIGSFIVLNLLFDQRPPWLTAVSNQFFLISTAIIAGTGQLVTYRSQREQIERQLVLERTTKNLEHAHADLKQLDRFKSEFFANITHELKTPLTMMLAPLELLVDGHLGALSDAQRSTLKSIQKSGVKLRRLIGDLLDLSRLEESKLRLRIGDHDLVPYLRALVAQAEPLAQRKALTLRFETDAAACLVCCDIERLERVMVNLLSNATKFTPPEGAVTIRLRDEGASVLIQVVDTGIGFPPGMATRIFDRFFQVDMADTRRYGGTGIGLALAKELVELHGGTIGAEGEVGEGATLSVRLKKGREHFRPEALDRRGPRTEHPSGSRASDHGVAEWQMAEDERYRLFEIDQATEQRIVERDPDEELRPYSVLVVEDTPDVIRVIRLALHHEFRVLAASDGKKGLELAKKHRPTLIVTDLMMPEMDGLSLTRALRDDAETAHIPIVMLTARSDVEDRVSGFESGVNAYLAKPFSTKELVTVVRAQLESRESTAELLLNQKIDSLQTIAGGLAHEIRNPLNYVKNALVSIRRDAERLAAPAPAEGSASLASDSDALVRRMQRMFQTADAGVHRIAATVDLMMRYSREGYTRSLQSHDVYAAIDDVLAVLLPTAGFEVNVQRRLEGDGRIACVPEEFNQVLTNLIENALHAMPSDGSGVLALRGAREGRFLVLAVRDNGQGITKEIEAEIFTPFFTTKTSRGTGLGLTIVRRVVDALGGSIEVASQVGVGAEFTLRVPALDARDPAGEKAHSEFRDEVTP
jgi:signal transduction histidine kinase